MESIYSYGWNGGITSPYNLAIYTALDQYINTPVNCESQFTVCNMLRIKQYHYKSSGESQKTGQPITSWSALEKSLSPSGSSDQIRSVTQLCPTLCDPMNRSMPGLPVHHQLPEFTQTHVHRVGDAIQPSHPLSSPSPPAPNPSQHQSLFQWVNSSHEVAKVLEFQL